VVSWVSAPVRWSGHEVGRVDVLTDRSGERQLSDALERARARVAEISLTDDVTGLANRKHFESEIDREHRRSQRAWTSYAVARIDVDGMAALNEALGKTDGDRLLRRLSQELKAARREYDLVARWENDELVVLLPGVDGQSVKGVLSRSIAAMREVAVELTKREVTFCVGVALWTPPSVETANDIVERAGTALQAAQLMGPSTVEIDERRVEWKDDLPEG
jgi:diguanylate cyclase (GGDEF)-like protein